MTVTTEVWTLIAVLAAVMLAVLAVLGGVLFGLAPRIDNLGATLRDELHETRTELRGEIAAQTARLDTMNLRLDEQVKETAGLRVEVGQILQRLTRVESAA